MGIDFILRNAKKIIVFGLTMALIAALLSTFIGFISSQVIALLPSLGNSFVPYFVPSNLGVCVSIVVAVKTAGTVYEAALQLLKWKVDTLA